MAKQLTKSDLVRQNFFGYAQSLVVFAFNAAMIILFPLMMGAYWFGVFSLITGIAYFVSGLFDSGFNYPTMKYLSLSLAKRKFGALRSIFIHLFKMKLVISIILAVAVFALSDVLAMLYGIPDFSLLLKIISPLIIFQAILNQVSNAFIGIQKSQLSLLANTINPLLLFGLVSVSFWFFGISGAIFGAMVSFLITSLLFSSLLFLKIRKTEQKATIDKKAINGNIVEFSLISFSNLFLYMGIIVLLGLFVPPEEVAYFKISLGWFSAIGLLIPISTQIFFSAAVGLKAKASINMDAYLAKVMKYSLIIIVPLMFGIFFSSGNLIKLIYGDVFYQSGMLLQIIVWSLIFTFMTSLFYGVMAAYNKTRQLMKRYVFASFIGVAVSLILIYYGGAMGAAISFFIASAVLFFSIVGPVQSLSTLNIGSFITKPLLSSVIMFLFLITMKDYFLGITGYAVLIAMAMFLYFAILFLIKGLSRQDMRVIALIR